MQGGVGVPLFCTVTVELKYEIFSAPRSSAHDASECTKFFLIYTQEDRECRHILPRYVERRGMGIHFGRSFIRTASSHSFSGTLYF